MMHILIIPSEEFVPEYNKLDGIFQYHQAAILKEAGYKIGALSVRLSFSVPMIVKAALYKTVGKKAGNATDDHSTLSLLKLGFRKLFKPQQFVTSENIEGMAIYRVDGLYMKVPANNKNHVSWVRAGMACFQQYLKHQGRPDAIHAHDAIYAGMLAQHIHDKYNIKYIITEHSSTYAIKKVDVATLERVKKAHKSAAGLYAVSEAFAGLLNGMFSFKRFQYLPNVLDPYLEKNIAGNISASGSDDPEKFIFLHIAVFKPVKDQHTLIRAFKKAVEKNPKAELWIGGFGDLYNELTDLTKQLSLQKSVKFLGLLNRDEVIQKLQECDCFVLSSKYETFGVVTIEAMLFGKPVIVTRCGVAQTIVNDKTGIIVATENEEQLANAMLTMMGTFKNYSADTIQKLAIDNFGKKSFLKKIEKVYSEILY